MPVLAQVQESGFSTSRSSHRPRPGRVCNHVQNQSPGLLAQSAVCPVRRALSKSRSRILRSASSNWSLLILDLSQRMNNTEHCDSISTPPGCTGCDGKEWSEEDHQAVIFWSERPDVESALHGELRLLFPHVEESTIDYYVRSCQKRIRDNYKDFRVASGAFLDWLLAEVKVPFFVSLPEVVGPDGSSCLGEKIDEVCNVLFESKLLVGGELVDNPNLKKLFGYLKRSVSGANDELLADGLALCQENFYKKHDQFRPELGSLEAFFLGAVVKFVIFDLRKWVVKLGKCQPLDESWFLRVDEPPPPSIRRALARIIRFVERALNLIRLEEEKKLPLKELDWCDWAILRRYRVLAVGQRDELLKLAYNEVFRRELEAIRSHHLREVALIDVALSRTGVIPKKQSLAQGKTLSRAYALVRKDVSAGLHMIVWLLARFELVPEQFLRNG